jgi:hypothetical protein
VVPSIVEKARMKDQLEGLHVFLAALPHFDVGSQDPEIVDCHPILEARIRRKRLKIQFVVMILGEASEVILDPNLN